MTHKYFRIRSSRAPRRSSTAEMLLTFIVTITLAALFIASMLGLL